MRRTSPAAVFGALLFASALQAQGQAPAGIPPTTRDFLVFCERSPGQCAEQIVFTKTWLFLDLVPGKVACLPGMLKNDVLVKAVRDWLASHPATHGQGTIVTIEDSIVALYPCKK